MRIDYIKLSPTGNITVLVRTPVPRVAQADLAARLLSADGVGGELVGYIEQSSDPRAVGRLQMMGGEFCGNATMSLCAVAARATGLKDGGESDFLCEVSGSPALVACRVSLDKGVWRGRVDMPLPTRLGQAELPVDGGVIAAPMIEMPGITHLILEGGARPDGDTIRRWLPEWCRILGAEALGALLWDGDDGCMDPYVYVPSAGTLVQEHGCGSGSAAIGAHLAARAGKSLSTPVRQPGGVIVADAVWGGGALRRLSITGRIEWLEEGAVDLPV